MARFIALAFALRCLQPCLAMPWVGPMETPVGLMATAGISPRPTQGPGLDSVPKELKPRLQALMYPPPNEWCGLVEGLTNDILSCNVGLTCINRGNAIGCCPSLDGACTALYTTCANYGDTCNGACEADVSIRKCSDPAFPYCGTYSFVGGTYLFNCQSTSVLLPLPVEFLADYYFTAIGSTLAPTTDPFSYAKATGVASSASGSASSHSSPVGSFSTSSSSSNDYGNNAGLAAAAIGGIAAGISLLVCVVAGVIVFFCLRSRKRKRLAASQAMASHAPPTYQPPPMQQQQTSYQQQQTSYQQQQPGYQQPQPGYQQPQTGYQSVPQQDPPYQGSPDYQPTHAGYFGGPTDPPKSEGAHSHVSPVGTPSPSNIESRPFSIVSSQHPSEQRPMGGLSPPVASARPDGGAAQEYYKQPNSPTMTEVDGTQGNPGVPHGQQPGRLEVEGTAGNPGVPYDQQHYQGPYEMR